MTPEQLLENLRSDQAKLGDNVPKLRAEVERLTAALNEQEVILRYTTALIAALEQPPAEAEAEAEAPVPAPVPSTRQQRRIARKKAPPGPVDPRDYESPQ